MHYKMHYYGTEGDLSADLIHDGVVIATADNLSDKKAADRWAKREARDHKVANTPEATEEHYVSVTGGKTFSL